MTSRERVLLALNHKEADRIAIHDRLDAQARLDAVHVGIDEQRFAAPAALAEQVAGGVCVCRKTQGGHVRCTVAGDVLLATRWAIDADEIQERIHHALAIDHVLLSFMR